MLMRPATRPQVERLAWLRDALRAGGANARELADRFEVNERTIRRDVEFARDRLGWPVEYNPSRKRFELTGNPPTLPAVSMSERELMAFLVAGRVLECYRGTPYADALQAGFEKLLRALDCVSTRLQPLNDPLPAFTFDPMREVDPSLFSQLYAACRDQQRLELTYFTASRGETTVRQVDPYDLLNHTGDWYLVAYCHRRQAVVEFAVTRQRMLAVQETGEKFTPDPNFDLETYRKSGFGVFKSGAVERLELRVYPERAAYVRERQWGLDQRVEPLEGGGLRVSFRAPVNEGLIRWILSYGSHMEVLEPDSLRTAVGEELAKGHARYAAEHETPESEGGEQ